MSARGEITLQCTEIKKNGELQWHDAFLNNAPWGDGRPPPDGLSIGRPAIMPLAAILRHAAIGKADDMRRAEGGITLARFHAQERCILSL